MALPFRSLPSIHHHHCLSFLVTRVQFLLDICHSSYHSDLQAKRQAAYMNFWHLTLSSFSQISGFAFIYMDDDRDAEYAIRALDRSEFGRKGRRLRVEWSKHEPIIRKPVGSRRSTNLRPSKTLFVINFPYHTKTTDLERHFDPYGKIVNVRIRRNFAFVQYETQEDATRALDATNMSKLQDRVISVEYSSRDDDERRGGGYSPDRRVRDRSFDRRRSPSPYRRERGSPDYGTGPNPVPFRRERGSPDYGPRPSRSPRRVERRSPEYGGPHFSRSPRRVERRSLEYGGARSSCSPRPASRHSLHHDRDRNRSPYGGERNGNGNGYGRRSSPSPEEGAISDDGQDHRSPINEPDMRDRSPIKKLGVRDSSPVGEYGSPVDARYRSPSPRARERSQS